MRRIGPYSMLHPRRVQALIYAVCFVIAMAAAPLLHQLHCNGVCAAPKFSTVQKAPAEGLACHGHTPMDGSASKGAPGSDGCCCLDDCCSITAHFTAPTVVIDIAPPTLLDLAAPGFWPGEAPRAPGVWLLPFATGPPVTA